MKQCYDLKKTQFRMADSTSQFQIFLKWRAQYIQGGRNY